VTQQDKEAEYREAQNQPLMSQPQMAGAMQYVPQQQNPAFHHGGVRGSAFNVVVLLSFWLCVVDCLVVAVLLL
jgi:hypothetical protein